MPRTFEQLLVAIAPSLFVVLWASGFIAAKFGLPYVEPLTFLTLRMTGVVILLGAIIVFTRPKWPDPVGFVRSCLTGFMVHGLYLGGVFVSIENGLSAGVIALLVSLQPVLTSTIANRWLGERVVPRQWLGLALGLAGVYLIVRENVAAGEAKPLAWFGNARAARHYRRYALSEALRRQHRLAHRHVGAICGCRSSVYARGGGL